MEYQAKTYEVTELGKIKIAPQVIEVISKYSTLEIEGVIGLSGGFTGEIAELLGRNNTTKGIKVELGEHDAAIDVSVIVKYGYSIPVLSEKIQENVKYTVENTTGLNVPQVNVHINGIHFDDKDEE